MGVTEWVAELEMDMEESQNQRDKRVEELWKQLDVQGTGYLDFKGLQKGLNRIDHPMKNAEDMLRRIMTVVDTNADGKIQYEEFRTFVEQTERQLMILFQSIDKDNNGRLDKTELQEAFRRAGLVVPMRKLSAFFGDIDMNNDGFISFEEWRDFLLFMPTQNAHAPLKAVLDFYSSIVTLTAEGDSMVSEETLEGLGYFIAGAVAGGLSRTATAPLDRLKVYLLVNTRATTETAATALKQGRPVDALRNAVRPFGDAVKDLWKAGGIRSLFAGNGLNVIKIMPESAIKFGSYEAAKRTLAKLEGHNDPKQINGCSKFVSGGVAGMVAQFCVYPLDTLKFRLQTSTVQGGLTGNALVLDTAKKMWQAGGMRSAYRGVTMGLMGMFPYSAIDMGTFEFLKTSYKRYMSKYRGIHEEDVKPGNIMTGLIGATSGAFGASVVYPLNVLRTRLQTQGTVMHPATYTGIWDVAHKTLKNEGMRGMYKGLTPNLLKVAPALSITWIVYENSKKLLGLE
ncbi:Calcium-binding mitochondrial carrier [Colletotrichum fructicola]|uniref:Mitochondrial thiamine pyrophosphate carrier 1 n=1 Tax=Colletotrichum fructicola (strain Nara gc5) TaxID=1213859 RepID=A0A7J6J076_COLFN|nr:Calcium-binding mitochondrial carrier [Colletotrichum fructicola]KAE9572352.1 Calcium-binding mitochondrial carrier [Colletotrichum fructicola]KAF4413503.1 Calcium-binding mitochondrial carrier SAL1 [Colletotrichum fructicola]KAF4482618.1 Calcium-binding mitochondrial carrier SAL1 [Colletotrichum fructicola Nara gc5]